MTTSYQKSSIDQQKVLSNLIREYDEKYASVSLTRNAPMSAMLFYKTPASPTDNIVAKLQSLFSAGYTIEVPAKAESLGPYPVVITSFMQVKRPIINNVVSTSGVSTVQRFGTFVKSVQINVVSSVAVSDVIHSAYMESVQRFRANKEENPFMNMAINLLGKIVYGVISSYTVNISSSTNGMVSQTFSLIVTGIDDTTTDLVPDTEEYQRTFSMDEDVLGSSGGENYLEASEAHSSKFVPVPNTLIRNILIQTLEMSLTSYVATFYTSMGYSVVFMNYGVFNGSLSVKTLNRGGVTQEGSHLTNLYNSFLQDYKYLHIHLRVGSRLRDFMGVVTSFEDVLEGDGSSSKSYILSMNNIVEVLL